MEKKYIKFFEGYRLAYGVADMSTLKVDPESGKQKPIYRWNDEELTEQVYLNHLEGTQSIGVQPCNENSEARFGVVDVDPKNYADFDKKFFIALATLNQEKVYYLLLLRWISLVIDILDWKMK